MPARNSWSRLTTPSALSKVASRILLLAHPPSCSRRGTPSPDDLRSPKKLFKKTKFYTLVPLCLCVFLPCLVQWLQFNDGGAVIVSHPKRNRRGGVVDPDSPDVGKS